MMKIGGGCDSIARTCIGDVCVRSTTSSGPGGSSLAVRRIRRSQRERRGVDVERVLRHPRRVAGRMVERREVVVVELDLGPSITR